MCGRCGLDGRDRNLAVKHLNKAAARRYDDIT